MSLAETQQIMALLTEISRILDGIEVKTTKINTELPRTQKSLASFRQLERVMLRYLTLIRRMGIPEEYERAIDAIAKVIIIVRMLEMSLRSLAGGPLGFLMGTAGIMITALTIPSVMEGY